MQRDNMAGREWIPIKAFLSIYWEDKEGLEQNIHLVIKIPGEFARWGGSSSWGLLLLTFSVVSPMDLSFKLADVEVWCYFLFLICCLKTSHISVSLWPTLDVLMFKESQSQQCLENILILLIAENSLFRSRLCKNRCIGVQFIPVQMRLD